ncbi:MAG: hypothetical protein AABW58_03895 [Nanoarchaeota archaeon]
MGYICQNCNSKHPFFKDGFCPFQDIIRKFSPQSFKLDFLGNTPPDIFVGEYNYPNVFTGILSPIEYKEENSILSNPEEWFKNKLGISEILFNRSSMIYSRFKSNVRTGNKLLEVMQEVSMSKKGVDVEFNLERRPKLSLGVDLRNIPVSNPAPLKKAVITENVNVDRNVEKLVYADDIKSQEGILSLYNKGFNISYLIKLLSAGLLGIKDNRRLVPTKWSITAVDTLLSKNLMKNIRDYKWVDKFYVFHDTYLGNHYEIILIPQEWSFEVIETKLPGTDESYYWQDFESYNDRKNYASDVTGAYYANRLSTCEYLEKVKRQAGVLVLREIGNYWAPLGVGILREVSRNAFNKGPLVFNNLKEVSENIQERMKMDLNKLFNRSFLLKKHNSQMKLSNFF